MFKYVIFRESDLRIAHDRNDKPITFDFLFSANVFAERFIRGKVQLLKVEVEDE